MVLNKIEDKPLLKQIVEQKGINAVKPIATIVTKETESFWAEKAAQMSMHTLETFVREMKKQYVDVQNCDGRCLDDKNNYNPSICKIPRAGKFPDQSLSNESSNNELEKIILKDFEKEPDLKPIQLPTEIFAKLEKLKGKKSWEDFFEELLLQREKWLKQAEPTSVKTYSRAIPAKIKHHILARSNKICEFKDCKKTTKFCTM